jgi:hypothetical protein
VEKTFVFSTNIKSYILALEKKQSFFCTVSPFQKGAYPQTASPFFLKEYEGRHSAFVQNY